MKRLNIILLMVGMVALVACNNTSFQPNTSKPTETSDNTSVEPTESSEPTDSSEATDPYKDRIKSKDFKCKTTSRGEANVYERRFRKANSCSTKGDC